MTTTASCAPLGDGVCDGFAGSDDDDVVTHGLCSCWCHNTDDLPPTVQGVRDWHDRHHGVEHLRIVREGLRPLVGSAIADDLDTESSASRQHYIDTGRYLARGEGRAL